MIHSLPCIVFLGEINTLLQILTFIPLDSVDSIQVFTDPNCKCYCNDDFNLIVTSHMLTQFNDCVVVSVYKW